MIAILINKFLWEKSNGFEVSKKILVLHWIFIFVFEDFEFDNGIDYSTKIRN